MHEAIQWIEKHSYTWLSVRWGLVVSVELLPEWKSLPCSRANRTPVSQGNVPHLICRCSAEAAAADLCYQAKIPAESLKPMSEQQFPCRQCLLAELWNNTMAIWHVAMHRWQRVHTGPVEPAELLDMMYHIMLVCCPGVVPLRSEKPATA